MRDSLKLTEKLGGGGARGGGAGQLEGWKPRSPGACHLAVVQTLLGWLRLSRSILAVAQARSQSVFLAANMVFTE